jgi:hypothetical protein
MECCELAAATIASEELTATRVAMVEEAPNSKRPTSSFEPAENTKEILVDPAGSEDKVLRIDSDLSPNRKAHSSTSSARTSTSSRGNPQIC